MAVGCRDWRHGEVMLFGAKEKRNGVEEEEKKRERLTCDGEKRWRSMTYLSSMLLEGVSL